LKLNFLKSYVLVCKTNQGILFDPSTGVNKLSFDGTIKEWKDYLLVNKFGYSNSNLSYYDHNLKPIFENVSSKKINHEQFKFFTNKSITDAKYIADDIYLCEIDNGYQFFSGIDMEPVSKPIHNTFAAGFDFYNGGQTYFTVDDKFKLGLFNTLRGEEFATEYSVIEQRMFSDGTIWFRTDNEVQASKKYKVDDSKRQNVNPDTLKKSIIQNSARVNGDTLMVSFRKTKADTHDSKYGTSTLFENGSGIFDLSASQWILEPIYHSIIPFKDHYVVMKSGGSQNASWLTTSILDKKLKPITNKEYGGSFIFNDMLLIRNAGLNSYIEYDVTGNKPKRNLGTLKTMDADFRLKDGYLLIVDNNYNPQTTNLTGMDIIDIISPEGQLVKVPAKRYRYEQILDDELAIVGRIPETEPSDKDIDQLSIDAYCLFDIKKRKILTPWSNRIYFNTDDKTINIKQKETDNFTSILITEVRKRFSD
jgi:hypothetical protein